MIRIDSEKERKKGGHLPSATFGRQGVITTKRTTFSEPSINMGVFTTSFMYELNTYQVL